MFFHLLSKYRLIKGKEDEKRIKERFGIANEEAIAKLHNYKIYCNQNNQDIKIIWVHAVSVGESLSVLDFVNKLSDAGYFIIFTTTTTTSARILESKLLTTTTIVHQYSPYQSNKFIKKFLQTWKPSKVFFVENEIFPNVINILYKSKIPIYLINARISQHSFQMWKLVRFFIKAVLKKYSCIFTINEQEKKKFEFLSDRMVRVECIGNLKIDEAVKNRIVIDKSFEQNVLPEVAKCKLLKQNYGDRKIIVFGSIHRAEFFHLLWQYSLISKKINCIGIFAPRYLNESAELERQSREAGFNTIYWSDFCGGDIGNLVIINEMNVLPKLYKICDFAVICGSFADKIGGHNPMESIVFAKPTFIGNYCCKSQDFVNQLINEGVLTQTQDIYHVVVDYCQDPNYLHAIQRNSDIFFKYHENVSDKIILELGL